MRKIGFIIDNLGPNELALNLINSANTFLENNQVGYDLVVFVHNFIKECAPPRFSIMNVSEAYSYDGVLVATNLLSANKILNYPGPRKKAFYIYDLEWLRLPNRNYDAFAEIYSNPKLELFCRSDSHRFFIENAWGRTAKVVEDFNVEEVLKCL